MRSSPIANSETTKTELPSVFTAAELAGKLDSPRLFTASEIGQSVGKSRFAVRRALAGGPPAARVVRAGNEADSWTFAALPPDLREAFARAPLKAWQPAIPLAELHPECLDRATKRRAAFAATFAGRFKNENISDSELATSGVEDYQNVFGHRISPRHWLRIFERITTRDSGAENWARLEIYLDDEKRLRRPAELPRDTENDFSQLADELAMWQDRLNPTWTEKHSLYVLAFEWLESAIEEGCREIDAKRKLIPWLYRHAGLSTNEGALRSELNQKLHQWRTQGYDAFRADKRKSANAKRRAPALSDADEKILVNHAVKKCDGFIATAWRECYHKLSPAIRERYSKFQEGSKRKDYVPKAIFQAIAAKVAIAHEQHRGPNYARTRGAFIPRNHDEHAGDIFSTDDATLEIYAAVMQPDGGCILTLPPQ